MAEEKKEKTEGKKGLPFVAKVLIIAIVLIIIVVSSVGSAFFIASKMNKSGGDGSNTVTESKSEKTKDGKVMDETKYGMTIEFGEYTVNLKEPEPRYLVVKINFELDPDLKEKKLPEIAASAEAKKVIMQDRVLSILRNKSIADLSADIENIALKKEITDEVNKIMGEEVVKTVRFNNWLIQ